MSLRTVDFICAFSNPLKGQRKVFLATRFARRCLNEKHWFSSQPSTNDSHTFKELFAQFCAEVASQSLANFRVHCIHFLACQCATPVAICQSICERLFAFTDFSAGKEIKKFNSFQ